MIEDSLYFPQQDTVCGPGRQAELVIMGLQTFIFNIRRKYKEKKGTFFSPLVGDRSVLLCYRKQDILAICTGG